MDCISTASSFRTSRNYTALKLVLCDYHRKSALERAEITQLSNYYVHPDDFTIALERAEITQLSNKALACESTAKALERAEITQLSNDGGMVYSVE